MCLINACPIRIRIFMIVTFGLMIALFAAQIARADMVIAPSRIVVNSNIDTDNYRNSSTHDTTVKAIIPYFLAPGSRLSDPQVDLSRELSKDETEFIASAVSIRYCFDDDNLIIEFDRDEVADYLKDCEIRGVIGVVVKGEFTVTLTSIDNVTNLLVINEADHEVNASADIFAYHPVKDK